MGLSERNYGTTEEPFSLTVDLYGRLWLHAKLEGVQVAIDLAEKNAAFEIIAATMVENEFEFRPIQGHDSADNDDDHKERS